MTDFNARNINLKQDGEQEILEFSRVLALSITYDLAIFETTKSAGPHIELAQSFSTEDFHYIAGYPEGALRRLDLAARIRHSDSLSYLFALNGESLSGHTFLGGLSGSPMLNEYGKFVALVHFTNRNLAWGIRREHIEDLLDLVRHRRGDIGVLCSGASLTKCFNRALDKTRSLAKHGQAVAQYVLGNPDGFVAEYIRETRAGRSYMEGQQTGTDLLSMLRQSADQDFSRAHMTLGRLASDEGDWSRAANRFELARTPVSLHLLSLIHYDGRGVPRNSALAFELALESASYGYNSAIHNVGVFIYRGWGVQEDREVGILWLERASSQGHGPSRVALDNLQ